MQSHQLLLVPILSQMLRTIATGDVEVQRNRFLLEKIFLVILSDLKLLCHTYDDMLRFVYIYIFLQLTFNIITSNKNCPHVFIICTHIYGQK